MDRRRKAHKGSKYQVVKPPKGNKASKAVGSEGRSQNIEGGDQIEGAAGQPFMRFYKRKDQGQCGECDEPAVVGGDVS